MTKTGMKVKEVACKLLLFSTEIIFKKCLPPTPPRRELFAEKNRKIMLNYSENISCTAKENTKSHFTIKQKTDLI